MTSPGKSAWSSVVTPVQPRIRLTRSYEPQSHGYQSYVLRARGSVGGEACTLSVAIGEAAHVKHGFQVGDTASGDGEPVADPRLETAALYRRARCACSRARRN